MGAQLDSTLEKVTTITSFAPRGAVALVHNATLSSSQILITLTSQPLCDGPHSPLSRKWSGMTPTRQMLSLLKLSRNASSHLISGTTRSTLAGKRWSACLKRLRCATFLALPQAERSHGTDVELAEAFTTTCTYQSIERGHFTVSVMLSATVCCKIDLYT